MPNDADRTDHADLSRMTDDSCPNATGDNHLHDLIQLRAELQRGKAPEKGRKAANPRR